MSDNAILAYIDSRIDHLQELISEREIKLRILEDDILRNSACLWELKSIKEKMEKNK